MHRRKPRKSGRKGVVLSTPARPLLSLYTCIVEIVPILREDANGRRNVETTGSERKREKERERRRGGFYPSSINDLANDSNVRLVTTLVNRAPPTESALPEKLRVSSSFTSHPSERKKNTRDLFYRVAVYRFLE